MARNRSESQGFDTRGKDGFDPDAVAKAVVQSAEMDQTSDYLARSRSHRSLQPNQLRADWVSAFKKWAHSASRASCGLNFGRGMSNLRSIWYVTSNGC